DLHEFINAALRIAQHEHTAVDHLGEVVRRNVRGHAYGNTGAAIDQQIGQARGQQQGLLFAAVVVGAKVDGFLVNVGQELVRDLGKTHFGITHGRGARSEERRV